MGLIIDNDRAKRSAWRPFCIWKTAHNTNWSGFASTLWHKEWRLAFTATTARGRTTAFRWIFINKPPPSCRVTSSAPGINNCHLPAADGRTISRKVKLLLKRRLFFQPTWPARRSIRLTKSIWNTLSRAPNGWVIPPSVILWSVNSRWSSSPIADRLVRLNTKILLLIAWLPVPLRKMWSDRRQSSPPAVLREQSQPSARWRRRLRNNNNNNSSHVGLGHTLIDDTARWRYCSRLSNSVVHLIPSQRIDDLDDITCVRLLNLVPFFSPHSVHKPLPTWSASVVTAPSASNYFIFLTQQFFTIQK